MTDTNAVALALFTRGFSLQESGRTAEAIAAYEQLLGLVPDHVGALNNIGTALQSMGRYDAALDCHQRALAVAPGNADALHNIGAIHEVRGNLAQAGHYYEQAIRADPGYPMTYFNYVHTRKITPADATLIDTIVNMAGRPEMDAIDRSYLEFALGKCFDDLGRYGEAFAHFRQGHALRVQLARFDPQQYAAGVDSIIGLCDERFFAQRRGFGSSDATPLLIVGMPRSGTTLVEQILASHPAAGSAGELEFWERKAKPLPSPGLAALGAADAATIANEYLACLRHFSPRSRLIIDKMPGNYMVLGLIRLCFPEARVIHCVRNPLDTCVSIYTQIFQPDHAYAHRLEDLAACYRSYVRMMDHWRRVLPGPMMDVAYEELVADQSGVSRRILEFCGLPWDDRCLEFHRNQSVVLTASSGQVRQPMYATSIDRWRHYGPFIEPLMGLADSTP